MAWLRALFASHISRCWHPRRDDERACACASPMSYTNVALSHGPVAFLATSVIFYSCDRTRLELELDHLKLSNCCSLPSFNTIQLELGSLILIWHIWYGAGPCETFQLQSAICSSAYRRAKLLIDRWWTPKQGAKKWRSHWQSLAVVCSTGWAKPHALGPSTNTPQSKLQKAPMRILWDVPSKCLLKKQ